MVCADLQRGGVGAPHARGEHRRRRAADHLELAASLAGLEADHHGQRARILIAGRALGTLALRERVEVPALLVARAVAHAVDVLVAHAARRIGRQGTRPLRRSLAHRDGQLPEQPLRALRGGVAATWVRVVRVEVVVICFAVIIEVQVVAQVADVIVARSHRRDGGRARRGLGARGRRPPAEAVDVPQVCAQRLLLGL